MGICHMCLRKVPKMEFGFETCSPECARTTAIVQAVNELVRTIHDAQFNVSSAVQNLANRI